MRIPLGESFVINIHREGERFIFMFASAAAVLFFVNLSLFIVVGFLTAFCISFFRDPERIIPKKQNVVVSAGDGIVTKVTLTTPPFELAESLGQDEMVKVSVFLSVFNCHVNRIPIEGEIIDTVYTPGKFINASLDKSSSNNERNGIVIKTPSNVKIGCVQIAGMIARRIVSDAKSGMHYKTGDRYGIIRFGSRMDLYLPSNAQLEVSEGQTVVGGETVIATLK